MDGDDDLRLYNLSTIRDVWFLSHDKPAIPEMRVTPVLPTQSSVWQRLLTDVTHSVSIF